MSRGDWAGTVSGGRFYPADPRPEDFSIEDIAAGLSKTCRYSGQIDVFYSVAEHSVWVSRCVPAEMRLQALLHDATEAYLGDITRPVKMLLPDYRALEARTWAAIAKRYGVPEELYPEVREADNAVLFAEKAVLRPDEKWSISAHPAPITPLLLHHSAAEEFFLREFNTITGAKQ